MGHPWENDNCEQIRAHYAYYSLPIAALLWCGVTPDQVEEELKNAQPHPHSRGTFTHPHIPCLEPRCRVLHEAIENGHLPCTRENGKATEDHVAPERRHIRREDLKSWIADQFPTDKPAFLFDEIERDSRPEVSIEAFLALQADRDHLKTRIEKAANIYHAQKKELETIKEERDTLKSQADAIGTPGGRSETTYLNIIGGLLDLILGISPAGRPQSVFDNQTAVISALLAHHKGKPGISQRTLETKFADAKRSLISD